MTRLTGDFQTDLPPPDALVACAEAVDGLGWQVAHLDARRIVSFADTDSRYPPVIEVELAEVQDGTAIRIIGTGVEGSGPADGLIAELDRVEEAIGACIERAPGPEQVAPGTEVAEKDAPGTQVPAPAATPPRQPADGNGRGAAPAVWPGLIQQVALGLVGVLILAAVASGVYLIAPAHMKRSVVSVASKAIGQRPNGPVRRYPGAHQRRGRGARQSAVVTRHVKGTKTHVPTSTPAPVQPCEQGLGTACGIIKCHRVHCPPPAPAPPPAPSVHCDLTAASGSAQALADQLAPGQTGCLRAGTYYGDLDLTEHDITLTSSPGERATIQGTIKFQPGADHSTLTRLNLVGTSIGPFIFADGDRLAYDDITNNHTEICVMITKYYNDPPPTGTVIEHNNIHDCGKLPSGNQDHGIYVGSGYGTLIRDNWIYNNVDRGVQLYPDAHGTQIYGNVITDNGEGIIFSNASSDNQAWGNVVSYSNIRANVESNELSGGGNSFHDNCVWYDPPNSYYGGGDGGVDAPGVSTYNNVVAEPQFVNRQGGDMRLASSSPCRSKMAS
jgi:hypothetical protein